jgi:hypothetical protein
MSTIPTVIYPYVPCEEICCAYCGGRGADPNAPSEQAICSWCNGWGTVLARLPYLVCGTCQGTGVIGTYSCQICEGTDIVPGTSPPIRYRTHWHRIFGASHLVTAGAVPGAGAIPGDAIPGGATPNGGGPGGVVPGGAIPGDGKAKRLGSVVRFHLSAWPGSTPFNRQMCSNFSAMETHDFLLHIDQ